MISVVIFVCIAGSRVSGRLGVPTLFVFIVLGMMFGSDGFLKIPFDNYLIAEQLCTASQIGRASCRERV